MKIKNLKQFYKQFNDDIFQNELPSVKIKFSRTIPCYALFTVFEDCNYYVKGPIIYINPIYNKNRSDFLDTLLHEMIHVWQWCNNLELNHGKEFNKWCDNIYWNYGWRLET